MQFHFRISAITLLLTTSIASIGQAQSALTQVLSVDSPPTVEEKANWYKGNLHTHSFWSDGNDFPDMIVKWYADRDYNFLALTDHNILSDDPERWLEEATILKRGGEKIVEDYFAEFTGDWIEAKGEGDERQYRLKTFEDCQKRFDSPGNFLLLTGEEISDRVDKYPLHMNATNLAKLLRPVGGETIREAMNNNLRAAQEQADTEGREIVVHLNHPNFGWAVTAEDLAFVTLEKFFEVYNGHPGINHLGDEKHQSVERIWDIANTIRIDKMKSAPLLGLGTDDCHEYQGRGGSQPGRGWIMVRATELTSDSLMQAINRGDFYSSSGVTLTEIVFDNETQTLTIQIEAAENETYTTQFIGTPTDYDQETSANKIEGEPTDRITRKYSADVGKVFAVVEGNIATYQMTGNELYVRALISSSSAHANPSFKNQVKQAWTQPVGWQKWVEGNSSNK